MLRRQRRGTARGVRTDIDILVRARPARSGIAGSSRTPNTRSGVRRAAPRDARRHRRLLRHHATSASTTSTACSGRVRRSDHPGTPRLFVDRFRRRTAARAFTPSLIDRSAEEPTRSIRCYLTTGRVLAQYQSGTQTRRDARAAGTRLAAVRGNASGDGARLGVAAGDRVVLEDAARLGQFTVKIDDGDPRGHGVRAVSLGRRAVRQPAHQPGARSDQQDARVQGLRDANRAGRRCR